MTQKILLSREFGKNILIRNSMKSIFDNKINKTKSKEMIIDFKGISFISRSCASEYIKLIEETNKNLIEKNMSNEVRSMFNLVKNQLKNVHFVFTKRNLVSGIKS